MARVPIHHEVRSQVCLPLPVGPSGVIPPPCANGNRSLPRNQVPEWSSAYINYKGLKKLIKAAVEASKTGQDADLTGDDALSHLVAVNGLPTSCRVHVLLGSESRGSQRLLQPEVC